MSASIIPQVGPAMICASSSTRMPASGPVCEPVCRPRVESVLNASGSGSAAAEIRLLLREERRIADPEILGVEAFEALVVLGIGERARIGETAGELLVPARDQRCAVGDPLRGR